MRTKARWCLLLAIAVLAEALCCGFTCANRPRFAIPLGARQQAPAAQQASAAAANQTTAPAPSAGAFVSEAIRPILGLSQESPAVRWAAVRALGTHLSQGERAALYDYLRGHEFDPPGPMRGVIKNDVILALKSQEPPPRELPGVLLSMFYDPAQDPVIRNYALQHLGTWYERVAEKAPVLDALWAGTADIDASIQGTALIGLSRLAQGSTVGQPASAAGTGSRPLSPNGGAEVDTARLTAVASTLATDPARQRCCPPHRPTSLRRIGNQSRSPGSGQPGRRRRQRASPHVRRGRRGSTGRPRPGPSAEPTPHRGSPADSNRRPAPPCAGSRHAETVNRASYEADTQNTPCPSPAGDYIGRVGPKQPADSVRVLHGCVYRGGGTGGIIYVHECSDFAGHKCLPWGFDFCLADCFADLQH